MYWDCHLQNAFGVLDGELEKLSWVFFATNNDLQFFQVASLSTVQKVKLSESEWHQYSRNRQIYAELFNVVTFLLISLSHCHAILGAKRGRWHWQLASLTKGKRHVKHLGSKVLDCIDLSFLKSFDLFSKRCYNELVSAYADWRHGAVDYRRLGLYNIDSIALVYMPIYL